MTATAPTSSNTTNRFRLNSDRATGFAIAFAGALLMSLDPLFIRFAGVSGADTAFLFGLFTAISMPLLLTYVDKRGVITAIKHSGWPLLIAALLMLGSSAGLVLSVKNTSIANTFIILAATPALSAIFSWLLLKEKTNASTWLTIMAVMLGITVVAFGSLNGAGHVIGHATPSSWMGDLMALFSVICLSLMFTLLRHFKNVSRLAAVGLGGLFLALFMSVFASPSQYSGQTWLIMALMGLLSAPIGRVFSMTATRCITAAEVSMTLMLETVLAIVWGLLIFNEVPSVWSLSGGLIILITVSIYTYFSINNTE